MSNSFSPVSSNTITSLRYVSRKEAAYFLGVSVRTLDRLSANDPTFPTASRIGRHRKWLLSELLAWMQRQAP